MYAGAGDETLTTKAQNKPAPGAHHTLPAAPASQLGEAELAVRTGEALEEVERLVGSTGGPVEHPASPAPPLRTAVQTADRTP